MTDEVDIANEVFEAHLQKCIAAARRPTLVIKASGYCLNCGDPVKNGLRWCNGECRDDWEAEHQDIAGRHLGRHAA